MVTPRKPDRFDKQALDIVAAWNRSGGVGLGAAIAAAESSALERARKALLPMRGRAIDDALARVDWLIAETKESLIPPAAAPAAEARNDPCQRCGKLGGHPVDFRFDGISMSSWICPHCLAAQEKRIAELEAALRQIIAAPTIELTTYEVIREMQRLATVALAARVAPPEGEGK